jgi:hypothetical protein
MLKQPTRSSGKTIFGAIGAFSHRHHVESKFSAFTRVTTTTNTAETIEFMELILLKINELQIDRSLVTVIADNHSANHSRLT